MERGRYPRRRATIRGIEQWRSRRGGHGRGSRIPEELWSEAVEMASVEGLWATSRILRLNYKKLKERMIRSAAVVAPQVTGAEAGASVSAPTFVELGMPAISGTRKAVIELVSRDGDRMHLEISGEALDLASLTRAFLEGRS